MPDQPGSQAHHPTGLLHVVTMNNEYIEDAWQGHAKSLIDDTNPIDSVKTFLLFRRLFKVGIELDVMCRDVLLLGNPSTIGDLCQRDVPLLVHGQSLSTDGLPIR